MRPKRVATQRERAGITCSTCGRRFFLDETSAPPFCSERCKLIDLGRWLDEDIGVPHEGGPVDGEITEHDSNENEAE